MGFLDALGKMAYILPSVKKPERRPSLYERFGWTGLVLLLFLIMGNVYLYGIPTKAIISPESALSVFTLIFGMRTGTLMMLGISPIVTAGIVLEVLVGAKIIELDLTDPEQREKFTAAQKGLAIILAIVEATAYAVSNLGGALRTPLTPTQQVLVIIQLVIASIIVLLFDELLQKGWGIGSAISLFILANVAETVTWDMFSIAPAIGGAGTYFGIIPELITRIFTGNILEIVIRQGLPDIIGLVATLSFMLLLIYLQGVRVEIPVTIQRYRGIRSKIPLNFLYVANIPVLLFMIFISDYLFFARIIWSRFNSDNSNVFLNILGTFTINEKNQLVTTGGLAYYLSPPRGILGLIAEPIRVLVYTVLLIIAAIVFGLMWVEVSGMSPRDQAEQLIKSGLNIPGMRLGSVKALEAFLSRYIYPLTLLSSIIVGAIAALAHILGVFGGGMGILLAVGIIYQYYQVIAYERALEAYPLLRRLIGE
ncbi:MAG: preprotein translocase subunit SecY [Desulfurococcales archaeon ex4484_217_1]|nr:MAG: preprotein translocase subunit SecY [Desulfurococcales archaeon ex4484_217_1]